ncbi:MAG TPA: ATP-binding protein, partial [Rhodocyclaceae bacterium]|nr:ATP-binding protein [Rhodocyclaceae bacterium]
AMDRSAALTHDLVSESIRHGLEEEQHAADLEQARAAAEAASVAKSRLLANMSHELRTPLNGVLGFGTLLEHTELTEEQKAYVAMQRQSGEHLLQLITDVLELSQLEAGMVTAVRQPLQFAALLDQLAEQYQPKALRKHLDFSVSSDAALAADLMGDQGKLQQILSHLTDNAIKFTEQGQVEISLQVLDNSDQHQLLAFTVSDSGIGIADEQRDRIFQMFTQGDDSSTRRYGGTGLGLAICRKLVDLLGGEIHVDSQSGQGSRFTFTLSLQRLQGSTAP